ncbi:PrgI family protein [Nonomuraea basaltis]|uniref:PrgI family protein n=1 Tax=Nonomuraea basaltis TaxID=2495887 RepID=UPI00110C41D5|nr:PrgI family protein [Nonomuraea basaltis]TMR96805.1 PrgI family protein [Nonomuraea basaltis]
MSWVEPVRIPADVEQPDKIIASFTARQLAILLGTGATLYAAYMAVGHHVPLVVSAAVALPIAVGAILLAIGQRDGISLDRYVVAAIRHYRSPKHLVTSCEDIPMPPTWIAAGTQRPPAPLKLPARGVVGDGLIDLGPDGVAAVAEVSTVSFALRTPDEQDALVAVFGRWLNSLSGPAQVLVRAERVDLTETVASLQDNARQLPHPALASAALEHAAFLQELSAHHDLLRRQVLLIIREPAAGANSRNTAAARALRRLDEASRVLGSCGLTARLLDARTVAALLASCFDPSALPLPGDDIALPGEVITTGGTW